MSGLPKWLRQAFGDTYSEDVIDSRMPTEDERERLEIPPDTPVTIIKGLTLDGQHWTLHFMTRSLCQADAVWLPLRRGARTLACHLHLDPLRVVDAPKVALWSAMLKDRHNLDALRHESNNGPAPL